MNMSTQDWRLESSESFWFSGIESMWRAQVVNNTVDFPQTSNPCWRADVNSLNMLVFANKTTSCATYWPTLDWLLFAIIKFIGRGWNPQDIEVLVQFWCCARYSVQGYVEEWKPGSDILWLMLSSADDILLFQKIRHVPRHLSGQ